MYGMHSRIQRLSIKEVGELYINDAMVQTEHTRDSCAHVSREIYILGYLHQIEGGCEVGIRRCWAILEAENAAEVLLSVPLMVRPQAQAVRLAIFTEEAFNRLNLTE
jgi:hypothetical protein